MTKEMGRFRNGEDLRYLPLIDRKLRLHAVVPKRGERLLYCDHFDTAGEALFRVACEYDLEGIVAKRKSDPYLPEQATWFKIRNPSYSQWVGREDLFERERHQDQLRDGMHVRWPLSPQQEVEQEWTFEAVVTE